MPRGRRKLAARFTEAFMLRDPVADWRELSALYEQAELLDTRELEGWLDGVKREAWHLLPDLRRMLGARARMAEEGFLEALPTLHDPSIARAVQWGSGSRVGAYRLVRHIGSGGMAEVWLADRADGAFERQVAIKLLFNHPAPTQRATFVERFRRERDILASLHHPNIAGLHDAGVTAEGWPWLALDYVEGRPITSWCDERSISIRDRVVIFRQVLMAVQHAHANLVIHRDLKPANILVSDEGQVRLLDFGIAKLLEPHGDSLAESELTLQSGRPLTLQYASPEQILGQPLTTACDQYSLGVVLYELLCGDRPYELELQSAAHVEQAIVGLEPREPSRRNLSTQAAEARGTTSKALTKILAPELDAVVLKCLSKPAADRYSSVEALAADLEHWLAGKPVTAKPTTSLERVWKFCRRHRLPVLATSAATFTLLVLTFLALFMSIKARDETSRAGAARDFLIEMFRVSDPDRTQGTEPTAGHILQSASDRAVVDLKYQPDLLAAVLEIVAQMQENLALFAVAETTLTRLAVLYEQLGNRRDLAMTQVSRALNAYQLGNDGNAEALIAQAAVAAAPFPKDDVLQAKLVLTKGWIARGSGKYAEAREAMQKAVARSSLAFGPNHLHTIEAMRGLAEVEGELLHYDIALGLLADAAARAERERSVDDRYRLEVAIATVNALHKAGHFAEAASAAKALMPRCEQLSGRRNFDCDFLRRVWATALFRSDAPQAALPMLDDLLAASANPEAPVQQAACAITAARVLAENGRLAAHPELRKQLVRLGDASSMSMPYRVYALLTLAEADLLSASYGDAEHWSRKAISLLASGDSSVRQSGRAKVTLALSLGGQGRAEEAMAMLRSADPELEADYGAGHPLRVLYGLNRASYLYRLGEASDAIAAVDSALPTMRLAFGSASPVVKRLEGLRVEWQRPVLVSESARFADMFF